MKRVYVKPLITMEDFMPNTYCSPCENKYYITSIKPICTRPGSSPTKIDGTGWGESYSGSLQGYQEKDARYHGSCGAYPDNSGSLWLENGVIKGKEHNQQDIFNVVIGGVNTKGKDGIYTSNVQQETSFEELIPGNFYYATWDSYDNTEFLYNHYGAIEVLGGKWTHS